MYTRYLAHYDRDYDLASYEIKKFEEKFFSSNREKIKNEKIFYENWLKTSLPLFTIETKAYGNEDQFLNSLQDSNLLMDLIEKIDNHVKFKRSKLSNVNKISNANNIIECLTYLNNKFNNQFQSIHYTDFMNGDKKKILSFLFLIKYSYETQIKNKECAIVNIRENEKKMKNEQKNEIEGNQIINTFDVSDNDDLKESGFETESESLTFDTFDSNVDILQVIVDNDDIDDIKIKFKKGDSFIDEIPDTKIDLIYNNQYLPSECDKVLKNDNFSGVLVKKVGDETIVNISEFSLNKAIQNRYPDENVMVAVGCLSKSKSQTECENLQKPVELEVKKIEINSTIQNETGEEIKAQITNTFGSTHEIEKCETIIELKTEQSSELLKMKYLTQTQAENPKEMTSADHEDLLTVVNTTEIENEVSIALNKQLNEDFTYTENHLNFCEIQNTILQQEKIKAHTFESDVLRKTNEKNEINALEITLKEVIDESKREHVDEETKCYDELVKKETIFIENDSPVNFDYSDIKVDEYNSAIEKVLEEGLTNIQNQFNVCKIKNNILQQDELKIGDHDDEIKNEINFISNSIVSDVFKKSEYLLTQREEQTNQMKQFSGVNILRTEENKTQIYGSLIKQEDSINTNGIVEIRQEISTNTLGSEIMSETKELFAEKNEVNTLDLILKGVSDDRKGEQIKDENVYSDELVKIETIFNGSPVNFEIQTGQFTAAIAERLTHDYRVLIGDDETMNQIITEDSVLIVNREFDLERDEFNSSTEKDIIKFSNCIVSDVFSKTKDLLVKRVENINQFEQNILCIEKNTTLIYSSLVNQEESINANGIVEIEIDNSFDNGMFSKTRELLTDNDELKIPKETFLDVVEINASDSILKEVENCFSKSEKEKTSISSSFEVKNNTENVEEETNCPNELVKKETIFIENDSPVNFEFKTDEFKVTLAQSLKHDNTVLIERDKQINGIITEYNILIVPRESDIQRDEFNSALEKDIITSSNNIVGDVFIKTEDLLTERYDIDSNIQMEDEISTLNEVVEMNSTEEGIQSLSTSSEKHINEKCSNSKNCRSEILIEINERKTEQNILIDNENDSSQNKDKLSKLEKIKTEKTIIPVNNICVIEDLIKINEIVNVATNHYTDDGFLNSNSHEIEKDSNSNDAQSCSLQIENELAVDDFVIEKIEIESKAEENQILKTRTKEDTENSLITHDEHKVLLNTETILNNSIESIKYNTISSIKTNNQVKSDESLKANLEINRECHESKADKLSIDESFYFNLNDNKIDLKSELVNDLNVVSDLLTTVNSEPIIEENKKKSLEDTLTKIYLIEADNQPQIANKPSILVQNVIQEARENDRTSEIQNVKVYELENKGKLNIKNKKKQFNKNNSKELNLTKEVAQLQTPFEKHDNVDESNKILVEIKQNQTDIKLSKIEPEKTKNISNRKLNNQKEIEILETLAKSVNETLSNIDELNKEIVVNNESSISDSTTKFTQKKVKILSAEFATNKVQNIFDHQNKSNSLELENKEEKIENGGFDKINNLHIIKSNSKEKELKTSEKTLQEKNVNQNFQKKSKSKNKNSKFKENSILGSQTKREENQNSETDLKSRSDSNASIKEAQITTYVKSSQRQIETDKKIHLIEPESSKQNICKQLKKSTIFKASRKSSDNKELKSVKNSLLNRFEQFKKSSAVGENNAKNLIIIFSFIFILFFILVGFNYITKTTNLYSF